MYNYTNTAVYYYNEYKMKWTKFEYEIHELLTTAEDVKWRKANMAIYCMSHLTREA